MQRNSPQDEDVKPEAYEEHCLEAPVLEQRLTN
jgi:hypothetical protein